MKKLIIKIYLLIILLICIKTTFQQSDSGQIRKDVCKQYEESSGAKPNEYTKLDYYDSNEVKDAQDFIKGQIEGKTYLRDYVIEDKINDEEFVEELIWDISPWLAFTILSLLGLIVYVCFFFCDICCPNCICCKKKSAYSKCEKAWPVLGLIIFCIYCIFSGSFGVYKSYNFDQGYYLLKCQIISFLDDFNSGNNQDKNAIWIGLYDLQSELEDIRDDMITTAENTFESSPWIEDGYTDITTKGGTLWDPNNVDKYTYNDYPQFLGQIALEGADSIFYQSAWKVYTDAFDEIIGEAILALRDAMNETNQNGLQIVEEGFSSAINSGINSVKDLIKTVDDGVRDIESNTKDIDDQYLPSIRDYVKIYFYISIFASVLGILAAILVVPLNLRKFRFCMHISWCVFSILMFAGFLISTILYGVTTVGFQGCDIMDRVLVSEKELKDLGLFKGDMMDYITICKKEYGGDGEILQKFGIDEELDQIRELNKSLNEAIQENESQTTELDRLTAQLESALENVDQMIQNGRYFIPDTTEEQNSSENRQYVDEYVLDTLLVDGFCNSKISELQPQSPACSIGWPNNSLDSLSDNANPCYYLHNFATNANENGNYCDDSETDTDIQDNLREVLAWVKDKNLIIGVTKNDLTQYDTAVSTYIDNTNTWFANLSTFDQEVGSILDRITIILGVETNCLFLGRNIDKIFQSLCVQLIPDLFWLAINLIIHCFGMYLGAFCLYVTGFRYNQFDRQKNYEEKEKEKNYERTDAPEYKDQAKD